jgi:hypothetical protein
LAFASPLADPFEAPCRRLDGESGCGCDSVCRFAGFLASRKIVKMPMESASREGRVVKTEEIRAFARAFS